MGRAVNWRVLWCSLFSCCCLLGCTTFPSSTAKKGPPDPLLEEIVKQDAWEKDAKPGKLKADVVLNEIPLKTPLGEARAIMARHGFQCWAGVYDSDNNGTCMQCIAYKPKDRHYAHRVTVKIFYEHDRVERVIVTVDYAVPHADHGFWWVFG